MMKIKVMADYQCYPLWDMAPGMYGDIDPASLPISTELKHQLIDWAREFDATLNMEDPASSGFESEEAAAAFKERGLQLARRLQLELGANAEVSVKV